MVRKVRIQRFDPTADEEGSYQEYEVHTVPGMTVMGLLDHIYLNLDPSLSYFSHSRCERGVCARCAVRVNGKNYIACNTLVPEEGDITIGPTDPDRVLKDLVTKKRDG